MLYTIQILLKEKGILLFEERFSKIDYNSKLFSGLLTAIQEFCIDINIGECNTFSSDKFKIITTATSRIVIAIIIAKSDPHIEEFWESLLLDIGRKFEETYEISKFQGKVNEYDGFNQILHEILTEREIF